MIHYKDIEGFPVSTVKGHAGKLIFGTVSGKKIVAMSGRFHLYEGYSTDDVTLPVRVFQLMGIKNYIVTNASGAVNIDVNIKKGVYCYCKGPMFETPAEIRAARALGADAVGMSTVPEVVAAVHGNMRVLGISCITNMAAGILNQPLTHAEVMETGKAVEKKFSLFMKEIISLL